MIAILLLLVTLAPSREARAGSDTTIIASSSTQITGTCSNSPYSLPLSVSSDRTGSPSLCGSSASGRIYVLVAPGHGVRRADFYVDGSLYQTEKQVPWDLAGGNVVAANAFDTSIMSAGTHLVSTNPLLDGSTETAKASFDVAGSTTPNTSNCTGTAVRPGQFTQSFVNRYRAGTTFCLRAGTHSMGAPVRARTGDSYIGESGAILDGRGSTVPAIWGYGGLAGQRKVTIRGLVIQNFRPDGEGDGPDKHAIKTGWGWVVAGNEIRHNYAGIALYNSIARNNSIHHNAVYGLQGAEGVAKRNEIAFNGGTPDSGGATGGTKILKSSQPFVFRSNNVHDNEGPGLWCDGFNRCIFKGNRVVNNDGPGISHELSYKAVIKNNYLEGNGQRFVGDSIWVGGNIMIHNSNNVEIFGNTIVDSIGGNGIVVRHSDDRSVDTYNVHVHDNTVKMADGGQSGFVTGEDSFEKLNQSQSGIRFANNTYYVKDNVNKWWRWGLDVAWAAWQAAGNDARGSRQLW
jgi:parallel beta-helix repeat protein